MNYKTKILIKGMQKYAVKNLRFEIYVTQNQFIAYTAIAVSILITISKYYWVRVLTITIINL